MRTWKDVATLVKTKGLEGRFVAQAAAGLPFLLQEGREVVFVPPQLDAPRSAVVTYAKPLDNHSFEIAFEELSDVNVAYLLEGCHCLVRRSEIAEADIESPGEELIGWRAFDMTSGELGTVAAMLEYPHQIILEIEKRDGRSTLVPLVDALIAKIDEKSRTITFDLPAGLVDL